MAIKLFCGVAVTLSFIFALLWRWWHADHHLVWAAHKHEDAKHNDNGDFAWRDCTGRAPSGAALKRAYRRLARQAHPDKVAGSDAQFTALGKAQQQLQSPLQYNLRAAFVNTSVPEGHGIRDARLTLEQADGGARVRLEVDFSNPASRGYWKFGLLAKDVSSIEYNGDGYGYDMCCQFLEDSRCAYKPYGDLVAQHAAHEDGAWDGMYTKHDCPLLRDQVYTGVINKPLHVTADGLWVAVLELMDQDGKEFACAAATFNVMGDQLHPLDTAKSQL